MTDDRQNFQQVVQAIEPDGVLQRLWSLDGGISSKMTALDVALPDGTTRKMIVRQPGGDWDAEASMREYRLLQAARAVGLATATPLLLDESGTILPGPYIVIDYIDGAVDLAPFDVTTYAYQLAEQLAGIHHITSQTADLSFLPEQKWQFLVQSNKRILGFDASTTEGRIRDYFISMKAEPPSNSFVLLHSDYWPGNILWRDGRLAAVIDWEAARLGEPLFDLCIARLDLRMVIGIEAVTEFTRCYQAAMPHLDYTSLPYWDLYACMRASPDLALWATSYAPLGRPDVTEQSMRAGLHWFMDQAFAAISAPE